MRIFFALSAIILFSCDKRAELFTLSTQASNTKSLIVGLCAVTDDIVWASGTNSTVLRSLNSGMEWESHTYPNVDTLQFRDIHASSENRAIVLSIGEGAASQIFQFTVDEGWIKSYQMAEPQGFLDCLDFWDDQKGIAYGDSFDGKPFVLLTDDGGLSWERVPGSVLPDAGPGEGGFASSGTCVRTGQNGKAWIGTGAGGNARILFTGDYGASWESIPSPMVKGSSAGITSISFEEGLGLITGGDLTISDDFTENIFFTKNGGREWLPGSTPKTKGAFYGSSLAKVNGEFAMILCGPNGADLSLNGGKIWTNISTEDLWTAVLRPSGIGWIAGRDGKILRIQLE